VRLASYLVGDQARAALLAADQTLVPIDDLVAGAPSTLLEVIQAGPELWDSFRSRASTASRGEPLSNVRLAAPIPRPRRNVFCVGWNYSEHFTEGRGMRGPSDDAQAPPEYPSLFSKQPNTVVGPEAPVWHPSPVSEQLDYEVELAVIIGTPGRDISQDRAYEHVFGYTVGNDVSVRDVQRRHGGQWFKGKSFDTHCPLGPWIVTPDELGDPHDLRISMRINGVTKQDSNTRFMVFRISRIISELSAGLMLEAGDVILTGTPDGVGAFRKPPEFLRVGDVMEAEIEKIGVLRNQVVRIRRPEQQSVAPSAAGH
jgi:2-keto-4-pentenoate hydratase/2-oxohepta-3-ene-1,7-dioic acid hydratase in catechol pathway